MVVGSPGGSTIFTTVMQVILNVFDFDMNAQEAVNVTRFHHQLPASMEIRYDLHREIDPELRRRLETLGYSVVPNSWGDLGDAHLVMINDRGELEAASDTRGRGQALLIEVPLRAGAKAAP
jgi:gamma-glutamyltranspeptidase/glutathione hydrolase